MQNRPPGSHRDGSEIGGGEQGRRLASSPQRLTRLLNALARALATAVAPLLVWRSMRTRRERAVQHRAQAELTAHLDSCLQCSELVRQIELAGYRLRMRSPPERRHGVGDVLSPRMDGRSFVSCECGWICSADSRRQAFDAFDAHLDAVAIGHGRGSRHPQGRN